MDNNILFVPIMEGTHIMTVYLSPEVIWEVLGFNHSGMTVVFNKEIGLPVDTVFRKDGEYSEDQEYKLIQFANQKLLEYIDRNISQ